MMDTRELRFRQNRELKEENEKLREIVGASLSYVQKRLPGDLARLCVLLGEPVPEDTL